MSTRAARWILWVVAMAVVPVPIYLVETARMPVIGILRLAVVMGEIIAAEGSAGVVRLLCLMLVGQGALYAVVLWVGVWMVTTMTARISARSVGRAAVALAAVAVVLGALLPVYRQPFGTGAVRTTLLHVYE